MIHELLRCCTISSCIDKIMTCCHGHVVINKKVFISKGDLRYEEDYGNASEHEGKE